MNNNEFNDKFAFDDINKHSEQRRLPRFNETVEVQMYQNHSTIILSKYDETKSFTTLAIGINPKTIPRDEKNVTNSSDGTSLEPTRRNAIYLIKNELEKNNKELYKFIQFDLMVDPTETANDIKFNSIQYTSLDMLEEGIEQSDYILIAWGAKNLIKISKLYPEYTNNLHQMLEKHLKKLYWLGHGKTNQPYAVTASQKNKQFQKIISSDLELIFKNIVV